MNKGNLLMEGVMMPITGIEFSGGRVLVTVKAGEQAAKRLEAPDNKGYTVFGKDGIPLIEAHVEWPGHSGVSRGGELTIELSWTLEP